MWPRPARTLLALAAINAFIAVAAGAFAAHALESRLDARSLAIFETAARYHMYAALGMGLCAACHALPGALRSGWLLQAGALLFSSTLYALALSGVKVLGVITPLGGALLLAGFASLALSALRK